MTRVFSKAKYLEWCSINNNAPNIWADYCDGMPADGTFTISKDGNDLYGSSPDWEVEENAK